MSLNKVEVEAKFTIPDLITFDALQSLQRLGSFEFRPGGVQTVTDHYLDTGDKHLYQAGFACRIRSTEGKQILTLKSLTPAEGNIHRRQEVEVEMDAKPLLDQPHTWVESEARDLVLDLVGQVSLQILFTLYQTRHTFQALLEDRPVIEFSLDQVSLQDAATVDYLELEAELAEAGTEADLSLFIKELQVWKALEAGTQSKFERAWNRFMKSESQMADKLTNWERAALEHIVTTSRDTLARRATVVLMTDENASPLEIARATHWTVRTVRKWQRNFQRKRLAMFPDAASGLNYDSSTTLPPDMEDISPSEALAKLPDAQVSIKGNSVPVEYPVRKNIGLEPTDTLAEAGRKVLGFNFARMLYHEPETRLGEDIEALHDMRVATRRMRAAFRVFGQVFSKKTIKPLQAGLKATGRALGRVRDLDVFMERLQHYQESLPEPEQAGLEPLLDTWRFEREQAREKMLVYLDSNKYSNFKQKFLEFVETEGLGAKPVRLDIPVPYQLRHIVPNLIYTRYEAVHAYEVVLENASLDTLHQLRITFKEFRYVLEYFREILGDECEMVIKEVKAVQDHLGDLNDANVASGILHEFLATWEQRQLHLPLTERQNPAQLAAYLNTRLDERHQLTITFPEVWHRFNRLEVRRNLALAISVL